MLHTALGNNWNWLSQPQGSFSIKCSGTYTNHKPQTTTLSIAYIPFKCHFNLCPHSVLPLHDFRLKIFTFRAIYPGHDIFIDMMSVKKVM